MGPQPEQGVGPIFRAVETLEHQLEHGDLAAYPFEENHKKTKRAERTDAEVHHVGEGLRRKLLVDEHWNEKNREVVDFPRVVDLHATPGKHASKQKDGDQADHFDHAGQRRGV
ncbi:MAG: hypothetical protein CL991_06810 [Euryarchaeota archaeon]|nr:hypothetical protein [Euryarchaeota archaeon]